MPIKVTEDDGMSREIRERTRAIREQLAGMTAEQQFVILAGRIARTEYMIKQLAARVGADEADVLPYRVLGES